MIRKTTRSLMRSFYREVIPSSIKHAWHEKWMWPWALFAGTVVTGGVFDVAANIFEQVRGTGSLTITPTVYQIALGWVQELQTNQDTGFAIVNISASIIAIIGLFLLTSMAQGVLTYGHGGRATAKESLARQSANAGMRHLFQIAGLTLITGFAMWFVGFILLIPYVLSVKMASVILVLATVICSFIYLALTMLLIATHLFSLNAIVHQGASLVEAIMNSWRMAKLEWLHIIELGIALFIINIIAMIAATALFVVMGMPVFLVLVSAALLNKPLLFQLSYAFGNGLLIVLLLIAGAIMISVQYGVWHKLFIQLGEGGIAPKIHRLARWFLGKA